MLEDVRELALFSNAFSRILTGAKRISGALLEREVGDDLGLELEEDVVNGV